MQRNTRKWILLGSLLFIIILDLSVDTLRSNWLNLFALTIVALTFTSFIFFEQVGGWLFIAVTVFMIVNPWVATGASAYLFVLVVFHWAWRGWWKQSLAAVLLNSTAVMIGFADKYNLTAGLFICGLSIFAFVTGCMLRSYFKENIRLNLQMELERYRQESLLRQIRQHISMELHDYTAGTLSRIVSLSTQLLESFNENRDISIHTIEKLELLHSESVQALRELRGTISMLGENASSRVTNVTLAEELDNVKAVAIGYGFNLQIDFCSEDFANLNEDCSDILKNCVREALTNLIKYGDATEECSFMLEVDDVDDVIILTAVNSVGTPITESVLSRGSGLDFLRRRVRKAGGKLEAGTTGNRWVLHIEVPLKTC